MKLSLALSLTLAAVAGIQAQDRAVPTDEAITARGCLQRAQRNGSLGGTVVGTSASPDRADDEANSSEMVNAFILAEAVRTESTTSAGGSADTRRPTSTSGTQGGVELTSFGLIGHEADLERHTGAQLEVTGVVAPPASSGRGPGGAATAAGTKRIRVASFKVLAEKCPATR